MVNGLPTMSFSPYGASHGPMMATIATSGGDHHAGDQPALLGDPAQVGDGSLPI